MRRRNAPQTAEKGRFCTLTVWPHSEPFRAEAARFKAIASACPRFERFKRPLCGLTYMFADTGQRRANVTNMSAVR